MTITSRRDNHVRRNGSGSAVLLCLTWLLAACLGRAAAGEPPKEPNPEERARLEKQAEELD
jgi:hypothetical protein